MKKILILTTIALLMAACTPITLPVQDTRIPPLDSSTPAIHTSTPVLVPSATATPLLQTGSTRIRPQDGMVIVYVPEGDFKMGQDGSVSMQVCREDGVFCSPDWFNDEMPVHEVGVFGFWIDRTEVTNSMYAACVFFHACQAPAEVSSATRPHYYDDPQYADYPVVNVSWFDAFDYCKWAGARMPTEAEWEKAARGVNENLYPWGIAEPDCTLANTWSPVCGEADTWKAGSLPNGASPYGALDMAGNAWEWVYDWYSANYYWARVATSPEGPDSGDMRVVRGGTWHFPRDILPTSRNSYAPDSAINILGFRCASYSP